jgi:hypothetical protein
MNPYVVLAYAVGTDEAIALGGRLTTWHDAMVAHERVQQSGHRLSGCDDDCPHAEAGPLWVEALQAFGERAHELSFLRAQGAFSPRNLLHSDGGRYDASSRQ